jgi:uncharacterized membrane protein
VNADALAAYNYFRGLPNTGLLAGDLATMVITPGVYFASAAVTQSAILKLDAQGNSSAKFIFQFGAAYAPAAGSTIQLLNGANPQNIYWAVTGAVGIGAGASFYGTVVSPAAITMGAGATLTGRVLAFNAGATSLSANPLTLPTF